MAKHAAFDAGAFYSALDSERHARSLNWKQVADEADVSASTLTRIGQGKRPDVDSLAALCAWSGLQADGFIRIENDSAAKERPEPLAQITAYLHSDPRLTPATASLIDQLVRGAYETIVEKPKPDDIVPS